ncbi:MULTISPECIES: hypothetical protein [Flavobacterium]|uniref:hypothetical protein n=1 Tax=Flavobacterium TaxID=237 RepID=UPI001FCB486B|nr:MULTISPECIES: hypothetical protein [Flavobacterium]UOK41624.1 hypothetical protein LZF87_09905 [Flavobacterium enshiense]
MKKISTILFLYLSIITYGQNTNLTVKEIDSIVNQIDLTCISGGIEDYTIQKKGDNKKDFGGGADWYYTDTSKTKLLKVYREYSIGYQNIEVYYFHQDSLIYLTISNITYDKDKKHINWEGQYYFQNNKLIFKQDNLKRSFKPEIYLKSAGQFFSLEKIWRI